MRPVNGEQHVARLGLLDLDLAVSLCGGQS